MNAPAKTNPPAGPWVPDLVDGTYHNPILFADYSDPDAIRVGANYWLTASSFCHVPGLPILHSTDLVNWSLVNHALPRLVPPDHFSQPRHGEGVWAPAIRFHEGRFRIYYPDPDFGLYVVTADDPRHEWSEPVLMLPGKGLIDPCPFWDEDGAGYLIHGWARSRSGIKNRLTLHRLRPDGFGVEGSGEVVIDGDQMPGWSTIEGPKLYRRGGYYYIFAPAGGVGTGYQAVFRSRNLRGPYESRIVLEQGRTQVNGPHQGAWVETPDGSHWFLHFQELPAYGRVVHLQPMAWRDDWPIMGEEFDAGRGQPVRRHAMPRPGGAIAAPATTDEFDGRMLGLQWQWQANPQPDWADLRSAPGFLRLRCVPQPPGVTAWAAPHLLMQKFPAPEFEVTTALDFAPRAEGDTAGLVVFGYSYAWVGLRRESGQLRLVFCRCDDANQGGVESEITTSRSAPSRVFLRVTVHTRADCQFAVGTDGVTFTPVGEPLAARSSMWVGAKVGLFATSRNGPAVPPGHADFDWFRVLPLTP